MNLLGPTTIFRMQEILTTLMMFKALPIDKSLPHATGKPFYDGFQDFITFPCCSSCIKSTEEVRALTDPPGEQLRVDALDLTAGLQQEKTVAPVSMSLPVSKSWDSVVVIDVLKP
ncbi:hypothetical protein AAES_138436 [Amazona aestiva]|uniref:Uncharacterized protein n=1 Tax=Amazona aestiva TaxID=12930 RepID=A0A0Q3M0E9_AMAAE|nr:hypothetical protein AAES_138436 [Amazona aestiva]